MGDSQRNHNVISDMRELSQITGRYPGSEGERRMLDAIRSRLPEGAHGEVEGFVAHTAVATNLSLHAILMLVFGLVAVWFPLWGGLLGAVVCISLIGEGLGRFSLLRFWMLRSASYNLIVSQRAEACQGTVIIAAPLDVPHWEAGRRRIRWFRPFQLVVASSLAIALLSLVRSMAFWLDTPGLGLQFGALGALLVAMLVSASIFRRTDGSGAASGTATLLELIRRFRHEPVEGLDVYAAFTGCGRAYQTGMESFLHLHGKHLKAPVFVIALERPGSMPLAALTAEGSLFEQPHRATGAGLVERLRWAGIDLPVHRYYGATDARKAQLMGYRALALRGGLGVASPEGVRRSVDIVEILVRWYAGDVAQFTTARPALEELAEAFRTATSTRRKRLRERRTPRAETAEDVASEPEDG